MHPFVQQALARLNDAGVQLHHDMLDDLYSLESLARAIKSAGQATHWNDIEVPLVVEGVRFHKPTVGAIAWANLVGEWFPEDPALAELAMLFCLADSETDWRMIDEAETARRSVLRWARRVRISAAIARTVLDQLMPKVTTRKAQHVLATARLEHGDRPERWPEEAKARVLREFVKDAVETDDAIAARSGGPVFDLIQEYGQDIDYWIYEVSYDRFVEATVQMHRRQRVAAAMSGRKEALANPDKVEAQGRFTIAARAFERKWLAKHKEQATPA